MLDWECGNRDGETLQRLLDRLKDWKIKVYYADHWEAYRKLIPPELLIQSKTETVTIEETMEGRGIGLESFVEELVSSQEV